jgi:hypothetical protein
VSSITTYIDESAVSAAIRGYGHIEGLVTLCSENNMPIDSDESVAVVRTINESVKQTLRQSPPLFSVTPPARQAPVVVSSGQSSVDLSLQEGGGVESLLDILKMNGLSINDDLTADAVLKVNGISIQNADVVSTYKASSYKVNNGILEETSPLPEETYHIIAALFDRSGLPSSTQWSISVSNGANTPHVINLDSSGNQNYDASIGNNVLRISKISEDGAVAGKTQVQVWLNGSRMSTFNLFTSGEVIDPIDLTLPDLSPDDEVYVLVIENINELSYDYTSDVIADYEVIYSAGSPPPGDLVESFTFSGSGNIFARDLQYMEASSDVTSNVKRTGNAVGTVLISWRKNGAEVSYTIITPGNPVDASYEYFDIIPDDSLKAQITETT